MSIVLPSHNGSSPEEIIFGYGHRNDREGAARCSRLLSLLKSRRSSGDVRDYPPVIHVAGTNGKGSCCAMLASVLTAAGYHTGLYTSPHLERFSERIVVDGREIEDDRLESLTRFVSEAFEGVDGSVSSFEFITALAMEYFREEGTDIAVVETGMGGRFDATNALNPILTIITGVSKEHTAILGNTVEEIAWHKAGIIKTGIPCIYRSDDPAVISVIEEELRAKDAPGVRCDASDIRVIRTDTEGTVIRKKGREYHLPLAGGHQGSNAALVLDALDILRRRGIHISEASIKKGLEQVSWPCRMEIICREPLFIADGGCDPNAANAVAESMKELAGGSRCVIIIGMLGDKDAEDIVKAFTAIADMMVCVRPPDERGMDPAIPAGYVRASGVKTTTCVSVSEAVETALSRAAERHAPVLSFGSLYLAAEIKAYVRENL